jgi:3-hydroxyisobutyrate dehydrogenase
MVKIGVIGTGLMGAPMALRLLSAGHRVWVYNRTLSRLKSLELAGATPCQTPLELLQAVDVVMLLVTNAQAIQEVLITPATTGRSDGQPSPLTNLTVIQMGTIAPQESRALQQTLQHHGAQYLEAPVLGSIPEAKTGKLIVMAGAEPAQFEQWSPLLRCFGEQIFHVGPVGTAAALKLAMNQMIGSLTAAFAQSLGLIQAEGIDVETFMAVLRQSALYAPTFDKKLKRMEGRHFADPNFPTKHLLKDMGLFVDTAAGAGLEALPADSVRRIVSQAVDAGFADDDYSSLYNILNPPTAGDR